MDETFWKDVQELYVVERHPKGGIVPSRFVDAMERNHTRFEDCKDDASWEIMSVHPDLEHAAERIRELKRRSRANGKEQYLDPVLPVPEEDLEEI